MRLLGWWKFVARAGRTMCHEPFENTTYTWAAVVEHRHGVWGAVQCYVLQQALLRDLLLLLVGGLMVSGDLTQSRKSKDVTAAMVEQRASKVMQDLGDLCFHSDGME